jgi:hypothetical protein
MAANNRIDVTKILGLCNDSMNGLDTIEAIERAYEQIGKWIQSNAKVLASDNIPEQTVPIFLIISIDNGKATVEKRNKFYIMES